MVLDLCSSPSLAGHVERSEAYGAMLESRHRRGGPISLTSTVERVAGEGGGEQGSGDQRHAVAKVRECPRHEELCVLLTQPTEGTNAAPVFV